mgnify:CR=1 FL=1
MQIIREILRMKTQCRMSNRAIGKALHISHTAVSEHIESCARRKITYAIASALSDAELKEQLAGEMKPIDGRLKNLHDRMETIRHELTRTGVTRQRLWSEYKTEYPDGYGYSQFCMHFQRWSYMQKIEMHVDHKAGDKMYVDYTGQKLRYCRIDTGELIDVEVFVAVLGASSFTFVEASENQKLSCFINSCANALHYFGGAPNAIVPDCLKSAVTKADRYEHMINKVFAKFGEHYQCSILPARPRKPKDKALVEGAVRIVYQQIFAPLRDRIFYSLAEINSAIAEELVRYNNRVMKGYGKSRREMFIDIDKPALKPLASRFEFREYQHRRAGANYHVYLPHDRHYYSVPYSCRGRVVDIWYTASHVEIYHENRRIAIHLRNYKENGYTTDKSHMPPQHCYRDEWNAEIIAARADAIGTGMRACVDSILSRPEHPEAGCKACMGLLSLLRKYPRADLDKACAYAVRIDAVSYRSVKNILVSRVHEYETHSDSALARALPEHHNIRGAEYYKELLQ